jgi:hypothetical protein
MTNALLLATVLQNRHIQIQVVIHEKFGLVFFALQLNNFTTTSFIKIGGSRTSRSQNEIPKQGKINLVERPAVTLNIAL